MNTQIKPQKACIIALTLFTLLVGCTDATKSKKTTTLDADAEALGSTLAEFNRGAALLEQYKFEEAAESFTKVLASAPQWTAARFNLGLAYLNMQNTPGASDSLDAARQAFEQVLATDPNHLSARFCLGLYQQYVGHNAEALNCFAAVARADPKDPYVLYKQAETLLNLERTQEGTALLEQVITLDPGFISAVYRLAIQYQRQRQPEKAKALFDRFTDLKNLELTGGTFTVLNSYGGAGKYYLALDADNIPLVAKKKLSQPRLLFSPELVYLDGQADVKEATSSPGLAAGDIDGDGDIDLCICQMAPDGYTTLWLNDGKGRFHRTATLETQGISPCFGDVDNDGDLDLWLVGRQEDVYFENQGSGQFRRVDVTGLAGDPNRSRTARLIDLDSDGDLDMMTINQPLANTAGQSKFVPMRVYNNNRDGSFKDVTEKLGLTFDVPGVKDPIVLCDDFDNDHDLDLIIFNASKDLPMGWVNDRVGQYHYLDSDTMGLKTDSVREAISGDPDGDGDRDILIFTGDKLQLYMNQGGFHFTINQDFANRCSYLGGTHGHFADMDNDGDLDIVIADAMARGGPLGPTILVNEQSEHLFTPLSDLDPGNLLGTLKDLGTSNCIVGDFDGNGSCDIVMAPPAGHPFLIKNITQGGHWLEIDLAGLRPEDHTSRSNNSAIGARVDIKTGTLSQQYVVGLSSARYAVPPHRVHAGLGPYTKVDWLRITWPDAILQAELEVPADQVIKISELQRKTSSCPHLFAWDGNHFQFIADFGGMGGMGYMVAPGQYAPPDPTEYLPVPDLQPRNGDYILQAIEPIEEIVYFDEAKLLAVDHPADTQVYPNEMMAVNSDPPSFELFCIRDKILPQKAVNHRGTDVTDKLLEVDRRYAGPTELDKRFVGMAKDHYVDIDFGDGLAHLAPAARVVLFASGWVEYGYSSTNFAAGQAKVVAHAPSIEVLRDGQWVELYHEVGYPAGIRHTMTVDMSGKLRPTDRRLRISTNMDLYWDQIFLAPVLTQADLHVTTVAAHHADLHFLGTPREYSPDGVHPTLYDYDSVDHTTPWKMMAGQYTRYGEVTELVQTTDDCYVIMGPGEELTLRFPAHAFGPVPAGYRRSFIFKSDSYCKDMDLYSAYPETVKPLPFHEMSAYPYPKTETYPNDDKHRQYQETFNTRQILRLED